MVAVKPRGSSHSEGHGTKCSSQGRKGSFSGGDMADSYATTRNAVRAQAEPFPTVAKRSFLFFDIAVLPKKLLRRVRRASNLRPYKAKDASKARDAYKAKDAYQYSGAIRLCLTEASTRASGCGALGDGWSGGGAGGAGLYGRGVDLQSFCRPISQTQPMQSSCASSRQHCRHLHRQHARVHRSSRLWTRERAGADTSAQSGITEVFTSARGCIRIRLCGRGPGCLASPM